MINNERVKNARADFERAIEEHIEQQGRNAKVYLSGRMSGVEPICWWNRFRLAQFKLEAKHGNVKVVNPAETIIARTPWLYRIVGYRFTLWYDLRLLKRCDNIYMVGNDWHLSRGARLERLKAREWGIEELKI